MDEQRLDPAYLVKDLNTAPTLHTSSIPAESVTIGGVAYFTAEDGIDGRDVWRSDGTRAGTRMLVDLPFGYPAELTNAGSVLYFRATDDIRPCAVWRSDLTTAGTVPIKIFDIDAGKCFVGDHGPAQFTSTPTGVFFRADDGAHGTELWLTDGTELGTHLVADIRPRNGAGDDDSVPDALTEFAGAVYFVADNGDGRDLWCSDGTAEGTKRVRDIGPGRAPQFVAAPALQVVGGTLLFAADDGVHGLELWATDGTAGGTRLLADTAPATTSGGLRFCDPCHDSPPTALTRAGDAVFFFVDVPDHYPWVELWRTDGTVSGTRPLTPPTFGRFPDQLATVGDRLFFTLSSKYLWVADSDGARELPRPYTGRPLGLIGALLGGGDALYFLSSTPDARPERRCELWRSDGTVTGTRVVVGVIGAATR